ncbi:hypothetical protein J6590_107716, partial [Homalodisca vitripennis]
SKEAESIISVDYRGHRLTERQGRLQYWRSLEKYNRPGHLPVWRDCLGPGKTLRKPQPEY